MVLIATSLLFLLAFSFIFSGTETAFFSLTDIEIKRIIRKEKRLSSIFRDLSKNKTEFLMVLLLCNTFVNISFISVSNLLFENMNISGVFSEYIKIFAITYVLLAAGEITPKILAVYKRDIFIKSAHLTYFIYLPLKPIIKAMLIPVNRITKRDEDAIAESEFIDILGHLKDNERKLENEIELLERYYILKKTECREIAVTSDKVVTVSRNTLTEVLYGIFAEHRYSRIPVLCDSEKVCEGIVLFKDLIYLDDNSSVKSIVRKVKSFDYRTNAVKMLSYFFTERIHMAILSDSSGKYFGIITLNDIIEKLTGPLPTEKRRNA